MEHPWGLPLSQYLNKPISKRHKSFPVTHEEAQRSIEQLLSPDYVSISTLENLLLLSRFPRHLRGLDCPEMIPRCIEHLKRYCREYRIFEYAYGYLCLRALCLVLDIAVLSHFNAFETQPEFLDLDANADILSETATNLLLRILKPGPKDHLAASLLKWHRLPGGAQAVCLPSAGGLSASDTEFIAYELGNDAKSFSSIVRRTSFPGLDTLLCVMTLRYYGLSDPSEKVNYGRQLRNITFRYNLSAPPNERLIVSHNCAIAFESFQQGEPSFSVDLEDTQGLLNSYTSRFALPEAESSTGLRTLQAMSEKLSPDLTPVVGELAAPFVNVGLSHIWRALDEWSLSGGAVSFLGFATTVLGQTTRLLRNILTARSHKLSAARVLFSNRVVDLFGRLILSITSLGSRPASLQDRCGNVSADGQLKEWDLMMNEIRDLSGAMASLGYREIHEATQIAYTWLKVREHVGTLPFLISSPDESYLNRCSTCAETWLKLGEHLRFMGVKMQQRGWVQCWYPLCAETTPDDIGARLSCSGCRVANYCGVYCQKADWLSGGWRSHHNTCAWYRKNPRPSATRW
ncbi:hypothetical protein FS749_003016 [Ceratobasidium sp. UAMH 11750]|nr:hypothetical protein FS749_003016 [Ceratobasidium sp. UAMH 11750]